MKTVIVNDEPIARRVLREELELYPEVAVIGEAGNGKDALEKIAELQPDLVFLDLQMPVMSGFEVVQNLREPHLPIIIIVTAFDEHALKAFEAGAVDYLLKPVSEARLGRAIGRARSLQGKPIEIGDRVDKIASAIQPSGASTTKRSTTKRIVGRNEDDHCQAGDYLRMTESYLRMEEISL